MKTDIDGRPYAKLSQLQVGSKVIVDADFEGCFVPWSELEVVKDLDGDLALIHNAPECGACGGNPNDEDCFHTLDGQLGDDDDTLIGIYLSPNNNPTIQEQKQ